jgi:hypothetical protein
MEQQRNQEKTLLNNLCVKRGLGMPFYRTVRSGGPDHCPEFDSVVSLGLGEEYGAKGAPSRKEAETLAASRALSALHKVKKTLLLIDGETMPGLLGEMSEEDIRHVTIYLLRSVLSKGAVPQNIEVVATSDITRALVAYLGFFMGQGVYERFIVASRVITLHDHPSNMVSRGLSTSPPPWFSKEILFVSDIERLHKILYI